MTNQETRINELEIRLKNSMEQAVNKGWTIKRNLLCRKEEKQCCAIGSIEANGGAMFSLLTDEEFNFIADGFDGAKCHSGENELVQLGRRLWNYAVANYWTI